MWHVSSRSDVVALRTAIHLLLTYLLTYGRGSVLLWRRGDTLRFMDDVIFAHKLRLFNVAARLRQ